MDGGDHVSVNVRAYFAGELGSEGPYHLLDRLFVPGDAGSRQEVVEELAG
jgi:hypothetical protein